MARLSDTERSVLGTSWNDIWWAASNGYTTTDTVGAFASVARELGSGITFDESGALATLYGYASRLNGAAGVFQAAGHGDLIAPEMIGTPPWAREEQAMATAPIWHATFLYTATDSAGNTISEKRTSIFEMTLPTTVGELADAIQEDALAMATKYNHQLVSADPISLLAV